MLEQGRQDRAARCAIRAGTTRYCSLSAAFTYGREEQGTRTDRWPYPNLHRLNNPHGLSRQNSQTVAWNPMPAGSDGQQHISGPLLQRQPYFLCLLLFAIVLLEET
jgi:hypothetical protein